MPFLWQNHKQFFPLKFCGANIIKKIDIVYFLGSKSIANKHFLIHILRFLKKGHNIFLMRVYIH